MSRRVSLVLLLLLALAAPALGDDVTRKHQVDTKIGALHGKLDAQKARESELRGQISDVTSRIRTLEARVGDVSLRLQTLEQDLALHQRRLDALNELYGLQTKRFGFLRQEFAQATLRLNHRIVDIYESDDPSSLDIVLGSQSLQDVVDQVEYLNQIAGQDRRIANEVASAKRRVRVARAHTAKLRRSVRSEAQVISSRASQTASVRNELVGARDELSQNKQQKLGDLSQLTAAQQAEAAEIDSLQAASASLGAQIRAAQAAAAAAAAAERASAAGSAGGSAAPADSTPSLAGLVWPASGPVTSTFGYRWGRLHEGIDIGAGYGAPINAAASGTVIYCGWESGYGNLTVLDHGNGLATAYGHQSSIAVACGQQVSQGSVIGYVGSTGHSTGPHLHFEVRINGGAVDPLGYL